LDGVVALGASAHEFFRSNEIALPYAATLVLGDRGDDSLKLVPFEATSEDWVRVLDRVFPGKGRVGVLATGDREARRLEPLRRALARQHRELLIQRVNSKTPLTVALRRVLKASSVFFFPRDRGLLRPVVAMAVLKAAYRRQVPVVAFSRKLVKAGAVLALDLRPEKAGEQAARAALGRPQKRIVPEVTMNRSRAASLGLHIPEDLLEEKP
jgi:ABC-type uncharacterized transport system substrate-binding protein